VSEIRVMSYNDVDLLEISQEWAFTQDCPALESWREDDDVLYTPGIPHWYFTFKTTKTLPFEGEIVLTTDDGGVASGHGYLVTTLFTTSTSPGCLYSYRLDPVGEASRIRYPEREAKEAAIRQREQAQEALVQEQKIEDLKQRVIQFASIPGRWSVLSYRHHAPHESAYERMFGAIEAAIFDIEWNYSFPIAIECDGVEVFDEGDVWLMYSLREWIAEEINNGIGVGNG